jgi:heterodisulfide reductase subunit B
MKLTYYPGCSLEGTARDYAESVLGICSALDIQLEEVPDWNCCGATAAHSIDHRASIELAARTLNLAAELPHSDMLVPCPMCFNRLKTAAWTLHNDQQDRYGIKLEAVLPKIWDFADFFGTQEMLQKVATKIKIPLQGLKVVSYYGCMANRPPEITETIDFEDPQSMDLGLTKPIAVVPVRCFHVRILCLNWLANFWIWPNGSVPRPLWSHARCVRPIWICSRKVSEMIGANIFRYRFIIFPN